MFVFFVFALPFCNLSPIAAQFYDAFRPDADDADTSDKAGGQYRSLKDYASGHIRSDATGPLASSGYYDGFGHEMVADDQQPPHHLRTVIVTRQILHPYHIEMEKKPATFKMAADKPYAFVKPYSLPMEKPISYPIKVYISQPQPQPYYDKQMLKMPDKPLPAYSSKPYATAKEKFFGQLVEKQMGAPLKSYDRPYLVHLPLDKKTPYSIEKPIPYPIYVPHERLVPVPVQIEKPYPVQYPVERAVPYPVPVPIRIPVEIPVPVPVPMTRHEPIYIPIQERPQEATEQTGAHSEQNVQTFAVPQFFVPSAMLQHIMQENGLQQNATTTVQPDTTAAAVPQTQSEGDDSAQESQSSLEDAKAETEAVITETAASTAVTSQPQTEESSTTAKSR